MYHAKNASLTFDNIKMDYVTFGRGKQPLVLIPGLSLQRIKGSAFQMSFVYRIFAKDYKVYMFDRKDLVSEGYHISDMANELARALQQLEITQADVVGISQGGMIAQYLAIHYPSLVHKLVLGVTMPKVNATVQSTVSQWIALAKSADGSAIVKNMMETVYSENYIRRHRFLINLMTRFMRPKELDRFVILAQSILNFDVYDDLKRIQCSVFAIGGKEDKVLSGQASREIAEQLSCPSYLYEGLGHSAYMEAKDFNQRILEFLKTADV
ncbi:alpha/beta fold hydrolase [Streptococcus dentiloxodontae]